MAQKTRPLASASVHGAQKVTHLRLPGIGLEKVRKPVSSTRAPGERNGSGEPFIELGLGCPATGMSPLLLAAATPITERSQGVIKKWKRPLPVVEQAPRLR